MLNGKVVTINLIVGLRKKTLLYEMNYLLPTHSKNKMEVALHLSNYATKLDLKNATVVDTLQFTKKDDLANLKSEVDKLDIDKLSKLNADKLKHVPVDVSKLSNVVKIMLLKICM